MCAWPEVEVVHRREAVRVRVRGAAAFPSLRRVKSVLAVIPESVGRVVIDLREVKLVDHTFLDRLSAMSQEWTCVELDLLGLDDRRPASPHPHAARIRRA